MDYVVFKLSMTRKDIKLTCEKHQVGASKLRRAQGWQLIVSINRSERSKEKNVTMKFTKKNYSTVVLSRKLLSSKKKTWSWAFRGRNLAVVIDFSKRKNEVLKVFFLPKSYIVILYNACSMFMRKHICWKKELLS